MGIEPQRAGWVVAALAVAVVSGGTGYLAHRAGTGVDADHPPDNTRHDSRRFQPDPMLAGFRTALAEALDPHGRHLGKVTSAQVGNDLLGTTLGWKGAAGLAEIMVTVTGPDAGRSGRLSTFRIRSCKPVPEHPCTKVRLPDGTAGVQQRRGNERAVYYPRPGGVRVLLVETTVFGKRGGVGTFPASARALLRAAADPRMSLAG